MAKKKQHGGKRPGAGRRPVNPEGKTIVLAASVPSELVELVDKLANSMGWNRSETVTTAIRALLQRHKLL